MAEDIAGLVERLRKNDYAKDMPLQREAAAALEALSSDCYAVKARAWAYEQGHKAAIKQISAERDAIAASDLGGALADALARIAELEVHIDDIETASELPHLRERITELEGALRAIAEDAYSHVGVARTIARAALRKEEGRD